MIPRYTTATTTLIPAETNGAGKEVVAVLCRPIGVTLSRARTFGVEAGARSVRIFNVESDVADN
jgi:hypothetical protein